MSNVTFALATCSDIALLQRLAGQIWRAHYPGIISRAQIEYMLDRMYGAEPIAGEMESGTCWELIRESADAVGFLSYSYDESVAQLNLHKLYVLANRHGQGLGRAGLARVMQVAAALGAREVSLFVNKNNQKAIRAYERAGFAIAESVVTECGAGFIMDDYRMTAPCAPK